MDIDEKNIPEEVAQPSPAPAEDTTKPVIDDASRLLSTSESDSDSDADDEIDSAPLKLEESEEVKEGIENETPESSWHGRDLSGIREPRGKLHATNWLADITGVADCELVKVQFKNTRTGFYRNVDHLDIAIGDMVAVEASPGHDIGEVAMVGPLVMLQLKKANLKRDTDIKKIFRKARPADLEKYEEAKSRELDTMIRSRRIAADLGLEMKIGDVEYQGDGGKAIFYYIADERVDFRKLIRLLADAFKVRIEMRQIGARQEAGRIGGIGPCGRQLCCASWMTHFSSVGTSMARMQDLSMNPQKLAGQCAKLKCCLNFEAAAYAESQAKLPHKDVVLQTKDADYYLFKTDVLSRMITYSTDKSVAANLVTIPARRAHEIIALNKQGIKVDALSENGGDEEAKPTDFFDLADQDSLTRFDKSKRKKSKNRGQKSGGQRGKGESNPGAGGDDNRGQKQGGERQRSGKGDGEQQSRGQRQQQRRKKGGNRPDNQQRNGNQQRDNKEKK